MYLANSKGQALFEHLVAVGNSAASISEELGLENQDILLGKFTLIAKLAGLFHDVGKIEPEFQHYISGEKNYDSEQGENDAFALTYPLHHEWSLLAVVVCWPKLKAHLKKLDSNLNYHSLNVLYTGLKYAVYWHHAEQQRDLSLQELMSNLRDSRPNLITTLAERFSALCSDILETDIVIDEESIYEEMGKLSEIKFIDLTPITLKMENRFETTKRTICSNATNLLLRYSLIVADRHVSSFYPDKINEPIAKVTFDDTRLINSIRTYIDKNNYAGRRTDSQIKAAKNLSICGTNTLVGPAGSGKTRVALMDYFYSRTEQRSEHKGILWMVPRVVVGLGVLDEIKIECPDIKVSILTGEYKDLWKGNIKLDEDLFTADIIIMTVDQIAKRLTRHAMHDEFGIFLERFVVFDEYHELFSIDSLYWVSLLLMKMKEWQTNGHVFISATPEPFHLKLIAESDYTYEEPIVLPSFNTKPIHFSFTEEVNTELDGSIHIFNTATKAQDTAIKSYIGGNRNFDCFHSRYHPTHKKKLTAEILNRFGKKSTEPTYTLFSGPIAQAALNISRQILSTEASSPANLLQRVGRCNRFAEHDSALVSVLFNKDTFSEKLSKYGYIGRIKNTGIRKKTIVNGKVIDSFQSHMSQTAYKFYRKLCVDNNIDRKTPLNNVSFTTNMNDLMTIYMTFWQNVLDKDIDSQGELFCYVIETADLLNHFNFFKPTKRVIKSNNGSTEVMVSYRGESNSVTMQYAQYTEAGSWSVGDYIATDENPENVVSISNNDINEIDIVSNISVSPFNELIKARSSLKYRAKAMGLTENELLIFMSKSPRYPLICSNEQQPNNPSLFYLQLGSGDNQKQIGIRKFKHGQKSLSTQGK